MVLMAPSLLQAGARAPEHRSSGRPACPRPGKKGCSLLLKSFVGFFLFPQLAGDEWTARQLPPGLAGVSRGLW